jgi:hypothetical protein
MNNKERAIPESLNTVRETVSVMYPNVRSLEYGTRRVRRMPKDGIDANWDPRIHMGKAWEVMIIEVRISYVLKEGDIATCYFNLKPLVSFELHFQEHTF